ncbi:hypothetical protein [Stenotrophomonas sp. JAI102]|uniref:hypothetical protein n=1 Tax=Stenotrophomonas sp. JAI102 TaxID=2723077 RepID=UPI0015C9DAE2|nr:hypothetical protein [Stenotrophomonas sp. JAI102]NYF35732.1 hypothetical protein [Stenotrophomonas sp. JAI102]
MIKRFAVLLSAAVAITGCSGPAQTFEIDNPGATPLTLRIDGNELPIAAHASRPVKLKPGEHHLQTEQLGDVRFIVYASGKGGLINPTLAEYVIANEIYVTGEDKLQHFGRLNNQIALGGVTFEGPYQATHDLFIDQAWSFGVREPFPEVQTVSHVDASGGRINAKIFTAPDFIAYVEAGMGQPGAYTRQQPKGYVAPVYTLDAAPTALPALDPAFEAHAGPLRELYSRYLQATTADAQLQLQQEAFQAQMAFTAATATLGSGLSKEANEGYNTFVRTRSTLMGSAALVVP